MNRLGRYIFLFLPALLLAGLRASTPAQDAAETVIIYNLNDPAAKELADFYCSVRGIEISHELPLATPPGEEISRSEYNTLIAIPLRKEFVRRGYWMMTMDMMNRPILYASGIRYAVLIRGMPLKIRQCSGYPGDARNQPDPYGGCNAASVDSGTLPFSGLFSPQISGFLNNPLYRDVFIPLEASGIPPALLLVSRLDAPSEKSVREMVLNGLRAEKEGLWGWGYIDLRSVKTRVCAG